MTDEAKAQAERLNKAEQFLRSGNLAGLLRQQDYYNKAHYVSSPLPYGQVADLIEKQAAELAKFKALAETLAGALEQMHRAVCHETGFAEAVRADSGVAYPWEPLDVAADASIKALTSYKEQRDA
ncbi:hypothetical protein ACQKOE_10045 [Novosphingobium sp. NPDC080210]|uniref:hypothetical protein n=1 Tax=Novosphingobium sp. NPDC080210 TaxID=3390596 RepID=UPI003D0114AD